MRAYGNDLVACCSQYENKINIIVIHYDACVYEGVIQ